MIEVWTFHTGMVVPMAIQNCAVIVDYRGKVTKRWLNVLQFDIGFINLEALIAFDISTQCFECRWDIKGNLCFSIDKSVVEWHTIQ